MSSRFNRYGIPFVAAALWGVLLGVTFKALGWPEPNVLVGGLLLLPFVLWGCWWTQIRGRP